jgi:filamentous hemagglutinin
VRGSNPGNTPYISTTDQAAVDPATLPKAYGSQQITVNTRDLQRDINAGAAPQSTEIVTNRQLVNDLQAKVDAAQAKFDANPSPKNTESLKRAKDDLSNAQRDGECLIKGCVPAPYFTPPTGPVTPIIPVRKPVTPPTSTPPNTSSKPGG